MIIKSKRIVCKDHILDGYIVIENGLIKSLLPATRKLVVDLDVGNNRVIPGIFDTHNHGTQGYSLIDNCDEDEIMGYLKGLASQGVTSVFPTCSLEAISTIATIAQKPQDGAKIVGIHSEGPWLNRVGEKGVKTGWPETNTDTAIKMIDDGKGLLKLVALAPEIPGTDDLMAIFLENGVKVAIAHSDMDFQMTNEAIDKGASIATHLCNVMTGLHHRDIGVLGACLLRDSVDCELICDGMHVSLPMVQLVLKAKDNHQIMMISDCTPMSGAPVGRYKGFGQGMEYINVTKEGFVLSDQGRLCGSSQGVIYGIRNLVEQLNIPIEKVMRLSATNPCSIHGIQNKGSIEIGKDADIVVIDDTYNVLCTYSEGRKVYDSTIDVSVFNPDFLGAFEIS